MRQTRNPAVRRIISGGQTGVDRGALDAAIELRIEHGGWCPRGRLAEDGRIPAKYLLQESESPEYRVRTELNVIGSDGTLILCRGGLQGGTLLTSGLAKKHGKPLLVVDLDQPPAQGEVKRWLVEHRIAALNVAGPRESSAPGIAHDACAYLLALLGQAAAANQRPK